MDALNCDVPCYVQDKLTGEKERRYDAGMQINGLDAWSV